MTKIPCGLCRDLIPLVKDGVASPESEAAVLDHIKTCAECHALYDGDLAPMPDDAKILKRLHRSASLWALALLAGGVLLGAGISNTSAVFYNTLLLPAIGAVGVLLLRRRVLWLALFTFLATALWQLAANISQALSAQQPITPDILLSGLLLALIYLLFLFAGIAIAALLRYALTKEAPHDR